jgi:HD superfamily phosphodiesterase
MKHLIIVIGLMWLGVSSAVRAADKIDTHLIKQFIDTQQTAIMQKDEAKLLALFAEDYRQLQSVQQPVMSKSDVANIYKNNFLMAKLIICQAAIDEENISKDGQRATILVHFNYRYLFEYQGQQTLLDQQEDWLSDIVLQQGQLQYIKTQKLLIK